MYIQFIIKTEANITLKTDVLSKEELISLDKEFPPFNYSTEKIYLINKDENLLSVNTERINNFSFINGTHDFKTMSKYQSIYNLKTELEEYKIKKYTFKNINNNNKEYTFNFKEAKYVSFNNLLSIYNKNENYNIEKMAKEYTNCFYGLNYTGISFIMYDDNKKKIKTYQITQLKGSGKSSSFKYFEKNPDTYKGLTRKIYEYELMYDLFIINNISFEYISKSNINETKKELQLIRKIIDNRILDRNNRYYFIEDFEKNDLKNELLSNNNLNKNWRS